MFGVLATIFVWAMFHSRAERRKKAREHQEAAELTKDNEKLVVMNKYSKFDNTVKEGVLAIGAFALVVTVIVMALIH
jgi:hypothetical protein